MRTIMMPPYLGNTIFWLFQRVLMLQSDLGFSERKRNVHLEEIVSLFALSPKL